VTPQPPGTMSFITRYPKAGSFGSSSAQFGVRRVDFCSVPGPDITSRLHDSQINPHSLGFRRLHLPRRVQTFLIATLHNLGFELHSLGFVLAQIEVRRCTDWGSSLHRLGFKTAQFGVRFFYWNSSQVSDNKLFVKCQSGTNLLNSVFNKKNNNKCDVAFLKI
jgi:hypothetical protein